jgi:hypothetical protein
MGENTHIVYLRVVAIIKPYPIVVKVPVDLTVN